MKKERIIRFILFSIFLATLISGGIFLYLRVAIPSIACLTIAVIAAFWAFVPYPFLKKDGANNENSKS